MKKLLILLLTCCITSISVQAADLEGKLDRSKTVSESGSNSYYITEDGTLWGWGYNNCGQLGSNGEGDLSGWFLGWEEKFQSCPIIIAQQVAAVSSGFEYTLFLKEDGTLWSCGSGTYGGIGTGSTKNQLNPEKIMDDVVSIEAGDDVSFAIKRTVLFGAGGTTLWQPLAAVKLLQNFRRF